MPPLPQSKAKTVGDLKEAVANLQEYIAEFEAGLAGKYAPTHDMAVYNSFLNSLKESLGYIDKGLMKNTLLDDEGTIMQHSNTIAGLHRKGLNPALNLPDVTVINNQLLFDATSNLGDDADPVQRKISLGRSDEKHRLQNLLLQMVPDMTFIYQNIDKMLLEKAAQPPAKPR